MYFFFVYCRKTFWCVVMCNKIKASCKMCGNGVGAQTLSSFIIVATGLEGGGWRWHPGMSLGYMERAVH